MLKKVLIVSGIIIALAFIAGFGLELWLSRTLSEKLNTNEDRKYDILFENVDVRILRKEIVLNEITIKPLKDDMPTSVTGSVKSFKLGDVKILKFALGKVAEIGQLTMISPKFTLIRQDSVTQEASEFSNAFQGFFGDIVSRGIIKNFTLEDGAGEFFTKSDSLTKFGSFDGFRIEAKNIETDSVILNFAIPFQVGSIETQVQNLMINLEDNLTFRVKDIKVNSKSKDVNLYSISLKYDESNLVASKKSEIQKDFIEVDLKHLLIEQLKTNSNIYGSWSVIAGKVTLDSLILHDVRNKNKPRPSEPEKPMFEGMAEKIPFPLVVDTIEVKNSLITYAQVSPGKDEPGELNFGELSALIYNAVSIDSLQNESLLINAKATLNKVAKITMNVQIPYMDEGEDEQFTLQAQVSSFDMTSLSPMLKKLLNVQVGSGVLKKMELQMDAGKYISNNTLVFEYDKFTLEILDENAHKKGFMSTVANILTSKSNLPQNNNYKKPIYKTTRDRHRGVFNFIWNSARDGIQLTVPSDVAQVLLPQKKQ